MDGGSATMDQCVVRYAGSGYPAVSKTGAGSLTLTNSTVSFSATNGIGIRDSSSSHALSNNSVINNSGSGVHILYVTGTVTLTGNTIAKNSTGIYCDTNIPIIGGSPGAGNNIFDNSIYGVQNTSDTVVNATYNWWGSPSGPYHPSLNPSGTGDRVSDNVDFGNFLTNQAVLIPVGQVSPTALAFGHVATLTTSVKQALTLTSTGEQPLTVTSVAKSGAQPTAFRIVSDLCSGKELPSGDTCTVELVFEPQTIGPMTASLAITTNDQITPIKSVPLSGYGAAPLPFVEPFDGAVSPIWSIINPDPALYSLTENPGNLRIATTNTDLYAGTNNVKNLFTLPLPGGLNRYMVTARLFFPVTPDTNYQQGGIVLLGEQNNAPDLDNYLRAQYVYFNGTRFETAFDINGIPTTFPGPDITGIGPTTPVWLRIIKDGTTYRALSSTDGVTFTLINTFSVPGEMFYAGVHALNGTVAAASIPVDFDSFEVTPLPAIGLSPTVVPFGSHYLGATAPHQDLTISNSGSGNLVITTLPLTGSGAFSLGEGTCGPLPITVVPQGSCNLTVTLSTATSGNFSATLGIGSNDPDFPSKDVSLSGTIVAPRFSMTITGSGGGSVNSVPPGVHCDGGTCEGPYTAGPATLKATPNGDSVVGTWGDACSSCSGTVCAITVTGDTSCRISFTFVKPARVVGGNDYDSLQAAYDAANTGATILAREYTFLGDLTCNLVKNVTIKGGYNQTYTTQRGYSIIKGSVTVKKGHVTTDRLQIN